MIAEGSTEGCADEVAGIALLARFVRAGLDNTSIGGYAVEVEPSEQPIAGPSRPCSRGGRWLESEVSMLQQVRIKREVNR